MIPLIPLAELPSHKDQLLSRVTIHISEQESEVRKLLPFISWHLPEERPFSINHFIVGKGKNEILKEGIPDAEGQLVVTILPKNGVFREIVEGIVHPTHVPLHTKSEAAHISGSRPHRPGGRFFSDGLHLRMVLIDGSVKAFDEIDGVDIFPSSVLVRNPLAFLPPVIEVEHGGHGVDPQTVDMIFFEPEESAADEKGFDFVSPVIEDITLPVGMISLLGIGMFIETGAIKVDQTVFIIREVRRHPIEAHSAPVLVKVIDEVHEVLGAPVSAGGGGGADYLIPPGCVERMLHHGEEVTV